MGGSVFCPLVGARRCAAVGRSGLMPWEHKSCHYLYSLRGCSSHLQHLEAAGLSSVG